MIKIDTLSVAYSESAHPVVQDLTTHFASGRLTAVIGPNGCGKSTLLKCIMGFLPPRSGEVMIDGRSIRSLNRRAMAQQIAYLPQENHCPDYITLGELVELGGYSRFSLLSGPKAHDRSVFQKALDTVGLSGMENRQVNSLSGGQRQRAWIAMVLAQDTETILLDEPVNHLDLKYQCAVLDLVSTLTRSEGKTVIAVLHDLNLTATYADDVLVLRDGRSIAAGPIADTLTGETIEEAFGLEADIFSRDRRLVCLPKRGAQNDLETGTR